MLYILIDDKAYFLPIRHHERHTLELISTLNVSSDGVNADECINAWINPSILRTDSFPWFTTLPPRSEAQPSLWRTAKNEIRCTVTRVIEPRRDKWTARVSGPHESGWSRMVEMMCGDFSSCLNPMLDPRPIYFLLSHCGPILLESTETLAPPAACQAHLVRNRFYPVWKLQLKTVLTKTSKSYSLFKAGNVLRCFRFRFHVNGAVMKIFMSQYSVVRWESTFLSITQSHIGEEGEHKRRRYTQHINIEISRLQYVFSLFLFTIWPCYANQAHCQTTGMRNGDSCAYCPQYIQTRFCKIYILHTYRHRYFCATAYRNTQRWYKQTL